MVFIKKESSLNIIAKKSKKLCIKALIWPSNKKFITFLLTKNKTSSLHHFEAYEYHVKICEALLSTHNQTKLLTGSIYPLKIQISLSGPLCTSRPTSL